MGIEIPTREDFDRLVSEVRALRQILEAAQPRDEWMTIEQACKEAGVSAATIRKQAREGKIEAKGRGKLRRFRI